MSDTDPKPTEPELDVEAEEEKLEDLGHRIEATRKKAEGDLSVGGAGRPFADEGVREQVAKDGDTDHPSE